MRITLNGEEHETDAPDVQSLINGLKLNNIALAVEHNYVIIQKEVWEKTGLKEDDKLELIKICGGG